MAKKKIQAESSEEVEVITPDVESQEQETTEVVETKAQTKKAKKEPKVEQVEKKNTKKPAKKTKQKKSLKKTAAEVMSEFQKVSKPSFGKVVKNTCVVVAVVAICTVLLFGMDKLFSLLYNLLIS